MAGSGHCSFGNRWWVIGGWPTHRDKAAMNGAHTYLFSNVAQTYRFALSICEWDTDLCIWNGAQT